MKPTNNYPPMSVIIALSSCLLPATSYADWGATLSTDNQYQEYKTKNVDPSALISPQYRGDKLNIDHDVSYKLNQSDNYSVEVLLDSKHTGFKAKDDPLFTGMKERETSVDIGARAIFDTGFLGKAAVDITKDVNASKGIEANIKVGGVPPHASHWTGKKSSIVTSVVTGLRFQSKKTADYYYGVKSTEATASRPAYQAKSAFTPYIGIEALANINKHFSIDASFTVEKQAKTIRNSPLTRNKKYPLRANVGFSYWF